MASTSILCTFHYVRVGQVWPAWTSCLVYVRTGLVGSGWVGSGQHGHRVQSCLIRSGSAWVCPTWTSGLVRLGRVWPTCTLVGSARVLPGMGIDSSLVGYGQHGHLVLSYSLWVYFGTANIAIGSSSVRLGMANMYIGRDGLGLVLPNMSIDSSLVGYGQHGYMVWSGVIRSLSTLNLLLLGMIRVVFSD